MPIRKIVKPGMWPRGTGLPSLGIISPNQPRFIARGWVYHHLSQNQHALGKENGQIRKATLRVPQE